MRKLLRDQSGRLYEIPLLIMFIGIALAIGVAERSALKGLGYAFVVMFGLLFSLFVLSMLSMGVGDFMERDGVKRFVSSRPFQLGWTLFLCLCGGAALAAACAFVGIFLSGLAQTPAGQLRIMQALTGGGAVLGFVGTYRLRQRKPE